MNEQDQIKAEFLFWKEHNPRIYQRIVRMALEDKAANERGSMKFIFERIRATGVSLRNVFTRPCADQVMEDIPALDGYFERGPRPSLLKSVAQIMDENPDLFSFTEGQEAA